MFNDIYEIRDIGTKTRFFFIGDNADFKPDKSLPSFTTKMIPHIITETDTISVIKMAKAESGFSYISNAGGAFLEWLEGKESPGVLALKKNNLF